jgi:hypothetical protein
MARTKPAPPTTRRRAAKVEQTHDETTVTTEPVPDDEGDLVGKLSAGSVGRAVYSVKRFLGNCTTATAKGLRKAWADGDQLAAAGVPVDGLPAVVILAAWGRRTNIDLVDDYEELLTRTRDAFNKCSLRHPDLFLASCICILASRGEAPTVGSFEQISIPAIFQELLGGEE